MCTGIVFQSEHDVEHIFNNVSNQPVMSLIMDITDGNFGANLPTPALNAIQQITVDTSKRKENEVLYSEMTVDELLDVLQDFGSFDDMPTAAQKALKDKTQDH
jgi:hypothetical protein